MQENNTDMQRQLQAAKKVSEEYRFSLKKTTGAFDCA